MKKINILFVMAQTENGGAQKALLTLASNLDKNIFTFHICTFYDKGNCLTEFENKYGVQIINLNMKSVESKSLLNKAISFFNGLLRLNKILKNNDFDIVQSFTHYPNVIVPPLGYLHGVPIRITSQRNSLNKCSSLLKKVDKLIANSFLVNKIISVSEAITHSYIHMQRINRDKIITIPNGIDILTLKSNVNLETVNHIKKELNVTSDSLVISVVARLHPQKGHCYLLEALKEVVKIKNDIIVLFIGHGELKNEILQQIKKLGLENNVRLLGTRKDVPSILSLTDIFVLPSLYEGMPNSLLEALALGIPSIATKVDGIPEIIKNENLGVLVPPADSEALKISILDLLENPEKRKKISNTSIKFIESYFSQAKNINSFTEFYIDIYRKNEHQNKQKKS